MDRYTAVKGSSGEGVVFTKRAACTGRTPGVRGLQKTAMPDDSKAGVKELKKRIRKSKIALAESEALKNLCKIMMKKLEKKAQRK